MRLLRERLRAARPMLAGRPHEAVGNGSPRWMAAGPRKRVHRTRPTGQLARCLPMLTSIDAQAPLGEAGLGQATAAREADPDLQGPA
jgi:hypothetical protein